MRALLGRNLDYLALLRPQRDPLEENLCLIVAILIAQAVGSIHLKATRRMSIARAKPPRRCSRRKGRLRTSPSRMARDRLNWATANRAFSALSLGSQVSQPSFSIKHEGGASE